MILAKGKSNRLPGKNLKDFHGTPMFLVNVKKCLRIFEEVYVSSDDDHILDLAYQAGAKIIKRGERLGGETPNITVYKHALGYMPQVDGIVAVQANSPQLEANLIVIAKRLMEMGVQELMTCHPIEAMDNYHDQYSTIYGSIWGLSRERLENYLDPYKPNPEVWLVDSSVDIENLADYNLSLKQSCGK